MDNCCTLHVFPAACDKDEVSGGKGINEGTEVSGSPFDVMKRGGYPASWKMRLFLSNRLL